MIKDTPFKIALLVAKVFRGTIVSGDDYFIRRANEDVRTATLDRAIRLWQLRGGNRGFPSGAAELKKAKKRAKADASLDPETPDLADRWPM